MLLKKKNKNTKEEAKTKSSDEAAISYWELYRYAGWKEVALMVVGTIAALLNSAGFPLLFLYFGNLTSILTENAIFKVCEFNYTRCKENGFINTTRAEWNHTRGRVEDDLYPAAMAIIYVFLYIGGVVFVCGMVQTTCWVWLGTRLSSKIRIEYFRAILKQEIAYHDVTSGKEVNSRIIDDVTKIEEGIGEKVPGMIEYIGQVVGCYVVAMISSYKVALVCTIFAPFVALIITLSYKVLRNLATKETEAYTRAGSIAEEAIASIRTVVAYSCQNKEVEKYSRNLGAAKKAAIKKESLNGSVPGLIRFLFLCMYALLFWYGGSLVVLGEIKSGHFFTSLFSMLFLSSTMGAFGQNIVYFSNAKAAGFKVFQVIDRPSGIDVFSKEGITPRDVISNVEFKNVSFSYPTRSSVKVLKNVSFSITSGQTVALVGKSGCGKSTILRLLQRFYDSQSGSIKIGGHDLTSLNVHWLRSQIGTVSQEPVLFATTIRENISWGDEDVTEKEIEEAAKQANAYDFIMELPNKFETLVGEKGAQMSGGQKQRIAIARAIVRNPKILILDEATSALDNCTEQIVKESLARASAGRTTIVVAQRLSTIMTSDKIIVLEDGCVVETGTHLQLLEDESGVYRGLVEAKNNEGDETDPETVVTSNDVRMNCNKHSSKVSTWGESLAAKSDKTPDVDENKNINVKNDCKNSRVKFVPENQENKVPDVPFLKILSYNKPEACTIAVGCFAALISGSTDPVIAVLVGKFLQIFVSLGSLEDKMFFLSLFGLMFFALGVVTFISYSSQAILFAKSGLDLVVRMRKAAFRAILLQDIAFFDDHNNSTGTLCSRLAADAYNLQGATGVRLATVLKNISAGAVGVAIAFIYSWHLALLMVLLFPLIAFAGFLQLSTRFGNRSGKKNAYEDAAGIAAEAIGDINTVVSLNKEKKFLERFEESLQPVVREGWGNGVKSGLANGYAAVIPFIILVVMFRLGIYLVDIKAILFENIFVVMIAIVYAARSVGQTSTYIPDYKKSKMAANRVIALINSAPTIDASSEEGLKPAHCRGEMTFESVYFKYPTRSDVTLLHDLTLSVKRGQTLAIVGPSGSGKSTLVQLIERFYDVDNGKVMVDGVNVTSLNVTWLRQQIGLVAQEPVLYDQTIEESILYGDCSRAPSHDEVVESAKRANIHEFIESLPQKYSTRIGRGGNQLSGGQKQRIAIARALLRQPKILLLDEATSALDAENEKFVQTTLDVARRGLTCILIAHRLSTVRYADQIAVMEGGKVVEMGRHEQLLSKKGVYYKLVNAQSSSEEEDVT